MAGSLDFPFGTGSVLTPVSAGIALKLDATVDPYIGLSPANEGAGEYPIGLAMYDSSSNPTENSAFTNANLYNTPVKLWFNTYLAQITGGLVTRGSVLYGVTGGFLSPVATGAETALALAGEPGNGLANPGQQIQVYKIYVS